MTSTEPIDPVHTRELRIRGVSRPRRVPAELAVVRHGAYADADVWGVADARERYIAFLRATARGLARRPLLSHASAGAVLALPVLGRWPHQLEQTVPENAARSSKHVVKHRRQAMPDAVEVGGFLVTPVARTVVDLAATRGFACGVMAADHALRRELCSREELEREVALLGSGPGCRAARAPLTMPKGHECDDRGRRAVPCGHVRALSAIGTPGGWPGSGVGTGAGGCLGSAWAGSHGFGRDRTWDRGDPVAN